jgi:hypothetical protein
MMTTIENIKKMEGECTKLCEESAQIWTNLVEDPKMKVVEARLRDAGKGAEGFIEHKHSPTC